MKELSFFSSPLISRRNSASRLPLSLIRTLIFHSPGITDGKVRTPSAKTGLSLQRFIPSLEPARSHIRPGRSVFVPIKAAAKSGPQQNTGTHGTSSRSAYSLQSVPAAYPSGTNGGSFFLSISKRAASSSVHQAGSKRFSGRTVTALPVSAYTRNSGPQKICSDFL